MKYLEIVRKYQPIVIGILVFWVIMQKNSNDTFIEDRDREFKLLQDSLTTVNTELYREIENRVSDNDSLKLTNDSLSSTVVRLDKSISNLNNVYIYEKSNIDFIGLDSNIILLSNFLSQEVSN